MRRPEPWAAGLFAVGLFNVLLGIGLVFKTHDLFDFGIFHASACGWWHGTDPYAQPNLNPPHASVFMAPLCELAPYPAWLVWQVVNLVAWMAALTLAWRTRPAPVTFGVVAVLVAHGSTSAQVHMGQLAWVLALPVTLSWLAFRRGSSVHAGLWLGLVLAVKPFLALAALPALIDSRWRATWLTAAVVALGIGTVGYVLLGSQAYAQWAAWSGPAAGLATQPMNVGLISLAWLLGVSPFAGVALGVAGALAVLPRWHAITTDRQWLLMLTMLVLSAPLGWLHYSAWTLPVLWAVWPTLALRLRLWAVGLLSMPTLALVLGLGPLRLVYPTGLFLLACAAVGRGDAAADARSSTSSNPIINS
jgi:alpha-1,2-mannosyltransferase/arabinofuranan 3-O-arabinosyltransferase